MADAMKWNVYKFTKPYALELLGQVDGKHQPAAWKAAAAQWPDLAKAEWPTYRHERLVLRRDVAPVAPASASANLSVVARGDLVQTWFDSGGKSGAVILYGIVEQAGPRRYTVRWWSDHRNRMRQGDANVKRITDPELLADAAQKMKRTEP